MARLKERTSRVFLRYGLSYALIFLIVFGLMTALTYVQTRDQVERQIAQTQMNRLSRIAQSHESLIASMLNTAEEIGLSPYIEPFQFAEAPWKAYELQQQLIPYTSANSFSEPMLVHFSGDTHLYSSASSMTVDMFCDLMQYENLASEVLRGMILAPQRMEIIPVQTVHSSLSESTELRLVTFILPLGANPRTSKGSILFQIRESVYESLFSDAVSSPQNTYVFVNDAVLASSVALPVDAQAVLSLDAGVSHMRQNGEDYLVTRWSGRSWGMHYVSVMRMRDVTSFIRSSMLRALAILAVMALLALLAVFFLAKRHARPIERLATLIPPPEGAQERDELHHISRGIERLQVNNRELAARLESALPMRRHELVLRILKGRFESEEAIREAGERVGLKMDYPLYAVILASSREGADRPEDLHEGAPENAGMFECIGVELVALNVFLYLCFARSEEELVHIAEEIRRRALDKGGRAVTAMSSVQSDLLHAPSAYLEAAAAYDNRFAMGERQVLRYDALSPAVEAILPSARTLTQSISQAVTLRNRETLDGRIRELMDFLRHTAMSPFAFRMIYNDVIDVLTRDHAREMEQESSAREIYDIFTLSSCQSLDDLDSMLRKLCDDLLTQETPDDSGKHDMMDSVTEYMQAHFQDPELSMTAIADSFDLTTARLSMAFKERMGMPPLDYLTLLRCEKAKELLIKRDDPIRDVGLQVGYYDSGSFIRRFKQQTGMTPLQYRRARREETGKDEKNENE